MYLFITNHDFVSKYVNLFLNIKPERVNHFYYGNVSMRGGDKICKTWSTALQTLPFTLPSSIIYGPYKMRKHRFLTAVTACLEEINGYLVKVTTFIISCDFIILSAMKKVFLKSFKYFHIFHRVTNISKSIVSVDVLVYNKKKYIFK